MSQIRVAMTSFLAGMVIVTLAGCVSPQERLDDAVQSCLDVTMAAFRDSGEEVTLDAIDVGRDLCEEDAAQDLEAFLDLWGE